MIGEKALSCFVESDIKGFLNGKIGILRAKDKDLNVKKQGFRFQKIGN